MSESAAPTTAEPGTPPTRDPVCGADVDAAAPPGGTVARGRYRYHFHDDGCRARFEAAPEQFFAIDPVCGMEVNPRAPRGGQHVHQGTTFFFCSVRCLARFQADPGAVLTHPPGAA